MTGASPPHSRWLVAAWARVEGTEGPVHRLGVAVASQPQLEDALDGSYAVIGASVGAPHSAAFFAELGPRVGTSKALACLERIFFEEERGVGHTAIPHKSTVLLGGYLPLFEAPEDADVLTQGGCQRRLEAWAQALEGVNGGKIPVMDHVSLREYVQRAAAEANSRPAAVPSPSVESEGGAGRGSQPNHDGSRTVGTTEALEEEENEEEGEEVVESRKRRHGGPSQHARRSLRVALLQSVTAREEPATGAEGEGRQRERKRKRHRAQPARQLVFPPGQPLPQGPFPAFCGTRKGSWDPNDPLVITIADFEQPQGGSGGRGRSAAYTVSCSEFERLGGRGRNKNWKYSVRIVAPGMGQHDYPIVKFAEALGQPFDFKPRGPAGPRPMVPWPRRLDGSPGDAPSPDSPEMQAYLTGVEEYKKKSILERMVAAGYDSAKAERRLCSELTFRGSHRPGVPGQYDYKLLLPAAGGVWVRSLAEISEKPMVPDLDEDDVIYPGDQRPRCGTKECFLVAGHAGRCRYPPGRGKGRGLRRWRRRRDDGSEGDASDGEYENVGDEPSEVKVEKQREDRQNRWSRRQWEGT